MAAKNPKAIADTAINAELYRRVIGDLNPDAVNDDFLRDEVLGEEFDSYTPTQKKMARDVAIQTYMFFDDKGEARDFVVGGYRTGDPNPYLGQTFSNEQMAAMIRSALPLYVTEDTTGEGVPRKSKTDLEKSGMMLELREGIDKEATFDAFGFPKGVKPAETVEDGKIVERSERGLPTLDEKYENRFRSGSIFDDDAIGYDNVFPDMRKLNEGGEVEGEDTTPYQNFFVNQQPYSLDQYTSGPVNFFQGALDTSIKVSDDDDDDDEVDAEALVDDEKPAYLEDPTEKPAIPPTTYSLYGSTPSFTVTSYGAGDFDINYTDYAKASYGVDKTDNFVKDALKDVGTGLQPDLASEAALAPLTASDPSGVIGSAMGVVLSKSVPAPFGKDFSTRPTGLTGLGFDLAMSFHAKNAAAVKLAGGKAGTLMVVNNMLVSRKPGDYGYTGNMQGLTTEQMRGIEATQAGLIAGTLRDEKGDDGSYTTTGMKGLMNAKDALKVGGNVSETGYFINVYGQGAKLTGAGGMQNKEFAAAYTAARRKYGVTQNQFIAALQEAQEKTGVFGTVRGKHRNATYLSDALKRMQDETQRVLKEEQEKDAAFARGQPARDRFMDRLTGGGYRDDDDPGPEDGGNQYSMDDFADDYAASYEGVDNFDFKEGGRVGLALGGQPPAAPAGFVEGKPEEFTDKEKVADDKPMAVNEGTFVINAAAVEMAGSEDIKQMLLKAYEIANQREGMNVDRPVYEEAVNVAVSKGEVIVPPQLARVIGYDRLEKINNRGKKETKKRIEETQAAAEGGFIGMSQGGFVDMLRAMLGLKKEPVVTNPIEPTKKAPPVSNEGFATPPPPPAAPSTPMPEATPFEDMTTDLLQLLEDNKLEGYIPNNNSGVTIGRGFDLGQHKIKDLERMGLDSALISRFTPYLNKTGKAARDALAYEKSQGRGLKFTKEEEGILEDLNLTVQRAKYEDFERIMGKLKLPMPHNDASRAAVFSEFYHGNFKTKVKDGGLQLTIRKTFMDEVMNTGSVYSAFQEGIVNKTGKGSVTRNRAEKTMNWLQENGGMVHAFDKLVPGDDAHYIDTRTGERLPPTPPRPVPPPPRPKKKNTGMMALPVPPPKNRSATR